MPRLDAISLAQGHIHELNAVGGRRGTMNTGKRMTHTKPWRGCQTCKQRRLRCDEVRPVCCNCTNYHRVCEYTPPLDKETFSPLQAPPFPQANHASASGTDLSSAGIPSSLDPYPQSLLPLTPAKRALLAFCKSFIKSILAYPGPTGSLQAD